MKGSCLCGGVSYSVDGPLRSIMNCHCVQCQKTSGHYVAATAAPREAIKTTGEVAWYQSSASGRRGFCATCGSSLFWDGGGENMSIHAGTLDGQTSLKGHVHIFVDDKSDYYDISDDIPQFPQSDL